MRVSELAAQADTTARTARFYEEAGAPPAPPAPPRQANGYRDYSEEDVCGVRLAVALRSLGLDLAESGRLAQLCTAGRCQQMADDLAAQVHERRAAVAAAMAELRHLDDELAALEHTRATGGPQATFYLGPAARTTTGAPR